MFLNMFISLLVTKRAASSSHGAADCQTVIVTGIAYTNPILRKHATQRHR